MSAQQLLNISFSSTKWMNYLVFSITFFFGTIAYSQEICNNGLDDDADGLIDLNDPNCACNTAPPISYIPNPSFESQTCCPNGPGDLTCATSWLQASEGTVDYFHPCDYMPSAVENNALPFPTGLAAVGVLATQQKKEYLSSCLPTQLVAGTSYTLELKIICVGAKSNLSECNSPPSFSPLNWTIFGAPTCSAPYTGTQCPTGAFQVLGAVSYSPINSWGTLTITFTPTFNVAQICIGPPCVLPADYTNEPVAFSSTCHAYFVMDDININTTASFTGATVTQTGDLCANNLVLTASTANTGGTWQWYDNGIAIVGQNTTTLNVSTLGLGGGNYTATYINSGGCTDASITIAPVTSPTVNVNSPTICSGGSVVLTATGATTYTWSPAVGLSATTGSSVSASPTSTTTYTVTGTTSGCSGTATSTVTVSASPSVNSNSPTVCSGTSTTLTATGATTYTWSPATGLSATTGSSVTANPTTTTTYTITGTTSGCVGTSSSIVTITPNPTIVVNSPTICSGGSAVLTATGADTYTWSPATGLSATTGSSVTANPTTTTTYTVTGTTSSGCTGTTQSTVTVSGSLIITVNSETICDGTSTTLTATGGTSYTWSPATGLSATTGSTVTANPSSTTTYTITGTSGSCSGSTTSTVTITPNPTISVNSQSFCSGGSAVLTAAGADTYTWSPATGLSTTTGTSVTASPTSTTTYTITGTTNGCNGTATSTVTVSPNPTISVNSPTICSSGSAVLTANGADTYTWSPATGLSSTTGSSVTASPTSTTTYTVTGTSSSGGCTGMAQATVTVSSSLVIAANSETICEGNSTTLTATGATTYTWSPATGLSATTGSSVTANPSSTTTYTITGTSGSCSGSTTSSVTVSPNPIVSVNNPTVCSGGSAVLTATGATTYTWSPTTGLSATTGSSVTANPSSTNTYTVTGTTNGCTGTAQATVTVLDELVITVNDGAICPGGSVVLTASGADSYNWSPATGLSTTTGASVTATPTTSTTYTIVGTTGACSQTVQSTVNVGTGDFQFSIDASPNPVQAYDPQVVFTSSPNSAIYNWMFPDGSQSTSDSPIYTFPNEPGSYEVWVIATSEEGCIDSSSITVIVEEDVTFFIPNTFTPDYNEFNNTFQPVFTSGFDPYDFNLAIFNRWGEVIYESNNATIGWDGTYAGRLMNEGTYTWKVEFKVTQTDERIIEQGHVNLIR